MNKIILFLVSLMLSKILFSQDSLKCFDKTKIFIYEVCFIEKNGDTLTKEKIRFKGNEKPWAYQKKQSELEIYYEPDYRGLMKFSHPFKAEKKRIERNTLKSKTRKSWANYTWIQKKRQLEK
jgi:hypothetical protein